MNTPKLAALTTALTFAVAAAQTNTTTTRAIVTAPGAAPMVMPLDVTLLPYGTIVISDGTYLISNYENTGINIYLQSPTALRVATLDEMIRAKAEWSRITRAMVSGDQKASEPTPVPSTNPLNALNINPALLSPAKATAPAAQPSQVSAPLPTQPAPTQGAPSPAPVAPAPILPATPTPAPAAQARTWSVPAQAPTAAVQWPVQAAAQPVPTMTQASSPTTAPR